MRRWEPEELIACWTWWTPIGVWWPTRAARRRAERRQREQQLTEQAVAQLRCSAGWQRWLTVRTSVGLRRYTLII